MKKRTRGRSTTKTGTLPLLGAGRAYPLAFRLAVVQQAVDKGVSIEQLSRVFGPSRGAIINWIEAYRKGGVEGLTPKPPVPPVRRRSGASEAKRERVVVLRREHPDYGTRRIRDILARLHAMGVSETEVRRILHEEGLIAERPEPPPAREHPERRFERAAPNQLWQSDIFTFLLRRHERLYLTAFMDDHSRFIVSHALAHHQKSGLVMEALERGIAEYGTPEEILTDQGRQYTAWRGETDFEQELRRQGIRHIKSRPQHPQTVGKVERFWKTLWDEFLSRTVFADYADCARRIALFIDAYNFRRPHQGIGGLVPADRFFRAAPHVREAIEKNIAHNAMELAKKQPVRKPFYLVGRLGDRDLTIAASAGGLRVQMGDDEPQTIALTKESSDGPDQEEDDNAPTRQEAQAAPEADAEVAPAPVGPRRDGQASLLDDLERAQWRATGDRSGRSGADLADDVLPDGDPGASGDARGADAGCRAVGRHQRGGAYPAVGEAGAGAREAQAKGRTIASLDEAGGQAWGNDDGSRQKAFALPELDERWVQTLACIAAEADDASGEREPLRAELDIREQALGWERKLSGARAVSEKQVPEASHAQEEDVRADARGTARGEGALRDDAPGDPGHAEREGGSQEAWDVAKPFPDALASWDAGLFGRDDTEKGGPAADTGEGGLALAREREAAPPERDVAREGGDDRSDAGDSGRSLERSGETAQPGKPLQEQDPNGEPEAGGT
jgi:transposase InsO family protein